MINKLSSKDQNFTAQLKALTSWDNSSNEEVNSIVKTIIDDVIQNGDQSVLDYTQEFDSVDAGSISELVISKERLKKSFDNLDEEQKTALSIAADRIRSYHQKQIQESWSYTENDGTVLGQKIIPLDRAGLYVPGGKAAYPSSVLMNAIPAKVAGVEELVMVVPTPKGLINELVLAAAYIAEVDLVFTIGGAQAIAALAYGTETIPKVDKIVGPGNIYVATAKRHVFGQVGIDMIAGPTDSLVIADGTADAAIVAADLVGQAEHGYNSPVWLVTDNEPLAQKVLEIVPGLIADLPELNRINAEAAWRDYAEVILCEDREEMAATSDEYAPEHLTVQADDLDWWLDRLSCYGSLFLGEETTVAYGDKASGPNHCLPTSRSAKYTGGLSVHKYMKLVTWQRATRDGAKDVAIATARISRLEGMEGHARTADIRLAKYYPGENFDLSAQG